MTNEALSRLLWAARQEARCHERIPGLTPDQLRILYHWPAIEFANYSVIIGSFWVFAWAEPVGCEVQIYCHEEICLPDSTTRN